MSREDAIRDMMDSMAKGNSNEVQTKFNSIMFDRASTAVNDYKQELAKSVFSNPEMQAMGLADGEEHVLEVDPAEEPQEVEGAPE
tara:strand:+ start:469 stop:723 length:255 start_codon:yes stop_codon:yes gene_type:complete